MRRWPILLAFVLGVLLTGTLLAQTPGVNVIVDDMTLPPGAGQILEGRTWIRLRSFESAGYVVLWDDVTRTARIGKVQPTPIPTVTATVTPPPPTASPSPSPSPVPSPTSTGTGLRFNVRDYGAIPNDGQDDTVAVHAAIAAAPNDQGADIHFPAGTYVVDNDTVENRSGLTFSGDGFSSIIQRPPLGGNTRILTFISSNHLVIRDLAFDENGIQNYGGVNFFSVTDVLIENTRHFDSRRTPIPSAGWTDRYSYVFGHGGTPSRDIVIRNNTIEGLQLEVDFAQRVTITDNTVTHSCCTAGIGGFSLFSGALMEDYLLERNTITDPQNGQVTGSAAIIFDLDPPNTNNVQVRRITIRNNTIVRHATNTTGILIGTPNNSGSTSGNVFEDIIIDGNTFTTDLDAPWLPDDTAGIKFNNHPATANIRFQHITIQNNVMHGVSTAMDLRYLQSSVVQNNQIIGRGSLVNFADGFHHVQVLNNLVDAGPGADNIPYWWQHSGGNNTFTGNHYLGVPQARQDGTPEALRIADPNGSDVIESPILQAVPSGPLVTAAIGLGALGLWARRRFGRQPTPVKKRRKREGTP